MTPEMNGALVDLVKVVTFILMLFFVGIMYRFCG